MPTFTKANDPNAARLIESLRHIGYDNYVALADLVDNSIDAGATHISITVQKRGDDVSIIIADDGEGMEYEVLDQALRLGSIAEVRHGSCYCKPFDCTENACLDEKERRHLVQHYGRG